MQRYYHYTSEERAQRILIEGLKPGSETGHQSYVNGAPCDNRFVYLAKGFEGFGDTILRSAKDGKFKMLSVDLPDDHPVERDMDVYAFISNYGLLSGLIFLQLMDSLKLPPPEREMLSDKGREYYDAIMMQAEDGNQSAIGIIPLVFAQDEVACKKLLSMATTEKWDKAIGFYRTPVSIRPNGASRIQRYSLSI